MILTESPDKLNDVITMLLTANTESVNRHIQQRKNVMADITPDIKISPLSSEVRIPNELKNILISIDEDLSPPQLWAIAIAYSVLDFVTVYKHRFGETFRFNDDSVDMVVGSFKYNGDNIGYDNMSETHSILKEMTKKEYEFILNTIEEIFKDVAAYV